MPHGVPTSAEKLAEFRAHYLLSGNASASAVAVGISPSTGREIAKELSAEESFGEERRALRDQAKHELLAMRMEVARVSLDRLKEDLPIPENVEDGGNVTIIDKRADYGKLVLEAEKNAIALDRYTDQAAPPPASVTINVSGPPGTSVEHSSG